MRRFLSQGNLTHMLRFFIGERRGGYEAHMRRFLSGSAASHMRIWGRLLKMTHMELKIKFDAYGMSSNPKKPTGTKKIATRNPA
jgi:hypothetical protein